MLNILIAEHNIRRLLKAHLKLKETAEKETSLVSKHGFIQANYNIANLTINIHIVDLC